MVVEQVGQAHAPVFARQAATDHLVKEALGIAARNLDTVEPVDFAQADAVLHGCNFLGDNGK